MNRALNTREKGMITVEATVSLTVFILVCLGVISFINIFIVHSRIQYAMYQAEKELSAYTYIYEASGFRPLDEDAQNKMIKAKEPIDKTAEAVLNMMDQVEKMQGNITVTKGAVEGTLNSPSPDNVMEAYNAAKGTIEQGKETYEAGKAVAERAEWIVKNPKEAASGVVAYIAKEAEDALKNWALTAITDGIVEKYLECYDGTGYHSGAEFLSKYGVVSKSVKAGGDITTKDLLSYDKSEMFTDSRCRMMDLVVEYDIEVYFFKMFMFDPTVHVVQKMKMPAWLGGDDNRYNPK
ncbi:MAG: pilus assembly protein [Lachnospiraceae bacterium]|nr:pilus assembly protein [Lachnospiraceae bacterium]